MNGKASIIARALTSRVPVAGLALVIQTSFVAKGIAGDTPFPEHVIDDEFINPLRVECGDLDHDGDQDIVVVMGNPIEDFEGEIYWFENDGLSPPSFTMRHLSNLVRGGVTSLDVGDINGDGHLDISLTTTGPKAAGFEWILNSGDSPPSFQHHATTMPPLSISGARLADVDSDGHLDAILSIGGPGTTWLKNDGELSPSFSVETFDGGPHFTDVEIDDVVDMDGDGDLDLLTSAAPTI